MNENSMDLFQWRAGNILDAASFREPEKVPVGFDYLNWPYGYAGVTLEDVIGDPQKNAEAYCRFMDDIEFDFTMNAGFYEPYDAYQALGTDAYVLHEDKCTVQHKQAGHRFMTDEEYEILIGNFKYFSQEYIPKTRIPAFDQSRSEAYRQLREAAKCADRCARFSELVAETAICQHRIIPLRIPLNGLRPAGDRADRTQEKSILELELEARGMRNYTSMYYSPIDHLFDKYRGMERVFLDLYDNMELLDTACAAIREFTNASTPPIPTHEFLEKPFPLGATTYHIAPYLNPEHYDKYWFQGFREQMLPLAEKGLKIHIKREGSFLHTIERFKEFPKGSLIIQLDTDDPLEAHQRIGGYQALCTGIRTTMLMHYNRQQCFDYLKRMFDALAPGGGFLFYQDMPLYSPGDAKPEVVREVWEFVNELAKGRA